jgi:hypothetical protein
MRVQEGLDRMDGEGQQQERGRGHGELPMGRPIVPPARRELRSIPEARPGYPEPSRAFDRTWRPWILEGLASRV